MVCISRTPVNGPIYWYFFLNLYPSNIFLSLYHTNLLRLPYTSASTSLYHTLILPLWWLTGGGGFVSVQPVCSGLVRLLVQTRARKAQPKPLMLAKLWLINTKLKGTTVHDGSFTTLFSSYTQLFL